eukprot:7851612-Karenia_brevis.AAC.1
MPARSSNHSSLTLAATWAITAHCSSFGQERLKVRTGQVDAADLSTRSAVLLSKDCPFTATS